ncbi:phosphodiester glycosidase family protein [Pyxidicoccus fallax]|uniref:Phosphodiester glycosidase family protein n=1 Tax=Pyxidicoccus fallax TaxID=394095 RepID=A0A848LAA6_9BACT|nr:phosphodiester glycosidase family protein [Pyxidicoccus fallax]NMO15527.1 phosphodiester glycosidase family protein [Pyxidicoccus fallax]NPC78087.1 phosphodiester glycosidase family protein [Pyxidicoccus fallax]
MGPLILVCACGLLVLGLWVMRRWRARPWLRWTCGLLLTLPASAGCVGGGYWTWFTLLRGPPEPARERWFEGVEYTREVRRQPRPMVAHVVRVDLEAPGIDFVVTPAEPSAQGDVRADTVSGFAARHDVQVAINANFFFPFSANHPLDYAPRVGEPVHVVGPAASRGVRYGGSQEGTTTLYLSAEHRAGFEPPATGVWHAISGLGYVVRDGARAPLGDTPIGNAPYPRTAVGVDASGRYLLLVVVDGKQRGYSQGATLTEVADLMLAHGAHTAIQLDGGGSSTLVRSLVPGRVERINATSNFRLPWWERPVANHLGVIARPLGP